MTLEVRTTSGRVIEVHYKIDPSRLEEIKNNIRASYPYAVYFTEAEDC